MSCIVYRTNKKSGAIYAYRQESYRDPISRKPRNRRTYLGRFDPETNQIVEKAERGRKSTFNEASNQDINTEITRLKTVVEKKDEEISYLRKELKEKEKRIQSLIGSLNRITSIISAEMATALK